MSSRFELFSVLEIVIVFFWSTGQVNGVQGFVISNILFVMIVRTSGLVHTLLSLLLNADRVAYTMPTQQLHLGYV